MRNENNLTRIKNSIASFDLYKKEMCAIGILLIGFIACGLALPSVKEQLDASELKPDLPFEVTIDKNTKTTEDEQSYKNDDSTQYDENVPSSKSGPSASDQGNSNPNNESPGLSSPSGKTWVPPVYKTVHHDAVYETRRVVICNYCEATFDTTGAFLVHKEANGG